MAALPVFQPDGDCTACELHECGAESVGIPTRAWDGGNTGKSKVVLVVGKCPATEEDKVGRCFVGPSGYLTNHLYIQALELDKLADFYLTNSIRCKLPNPKMSIPPSSRTACKQHLVRDVQELSRHYDEVILLATGSEAIQTLFGRKVSMTSVTQGGVVDVGGVPCKVFVTYLATMLLPGADPSKATVVEAHLRLLKEYLQTGELSYEVEIAEEDVSRTAVIPPDVPLLSLDIETYGCLETLPRQKFFHPQKSLYWDGVAKEDLVVSVAACWRDGGGVVRNRFWNVTVPAERQDFLRQMESLQSPTILGQNLPFDMMYLRRGRIGLQPSPNHLELTGSWWTYG
jgi:uracil-DNA glycosylase family 4